MASVGPVGRFFDVHVLRQRMVCALCDRLDGETVVKGVWSNIRLCFTVMAAFCVTVPMWACQEGTRSSSESSRDVSGAMGVLLPDTSEFLEQQWQAYWAKHRDIPQSEARRQFDIIQAMSADVYDERIAAWADRRALALAWLEHDVENVFSPDKVSDELIRQAIDAYAFKSGHPALMTVSHVLVRADGRSSEEARQEAVKTAHAFLMARLNARHNLGDEDLREVATLLMQAGFRVDMNPDLTFPRAPIEPFMGEMPLYRYVVEPFAEAAFGLSAEHPLSEPVRSEFGTHIILFKKFEPEKKASFADDYEFMRANIVQFGRKAGVDMYLAALMHNDELLKNMMSKDERFNALLRQNVEILVNEERLREIVGLQNVSKNEASVSK